MSADSAGELNSGQTHACARQSVRDEEIDLTDCVLVLLRHKWLIVLASLTPALLTAALLFFRPGKSTVGYMYRLETGEADLKIIRESFYSSENISKLARKLGEHGFARHGRVLTAAKNLQELQQIVHFDVSPPYFSREARTLEEVLQRGDIRAPLLQLQVYTSSSADLVGIAAVYRDNFEQRVSLFQERGKLLAKTAELKKTLAAIEESRHLLGLELQRKMSTLKRLESSAADASDRLPSEVVLQFDVSDGGNPYLPLPYQIQAARTKIINLEEEIQGNSDKYAYYRELLTVHDVLLGYLEGADQQDLTLDAFHAFLTEVVAGPAGETPHLRDYLAAYTKRIESAKTGTVPITDHPAVYADAKGIARKTAIVFVVALLLSVFGAFLREGLHQKGSFVGQN